MPRLSHKYRVNANVHHQVGLAALACLSVMATAGIVGLTPGLAAAVTNSHITTAVAPAVTTQPMNQSVIVGDSATFTAAASGTPNPTVQWLVSTDGGHLFNAIPDATTDTLIIAGTTFAQDRNQYQALFTNIQGTALTSPATLTVTNAPKGHGYWLVASDGGVFSFGDAGFHGSTGNLNLNKPIVGMAATPDRHGYWMVASDGGVFAFGNAAFFGSTGSLHLNQPIVGITATSDGLGYWLVASDGGIFAFGDAVFYGSTGALHLNKPIVGMASDLDNLGYWLVASDGGVFSFGNDLFHGSTGALHLNQPVVGMAFSNNPMGESTVDNDLAGYWLVASDGGIFNFGTAIFFGSTANLHLNKPIVGMAAVSDAQGYWLVASDGGVFNFGDAGFYGSTGSLHLNQPIVGMAAT